MNRTFNLYCDESTHLENDKMPFMLISYVGCPYNQVKDCNKKIKELKLKHFFHGEIKWSGVSHSMYKFYEELIEFFFCSPLYFRSVIVDKSQINNNLPGFSFDEFYYKMYYQLLHHKMDMQCKYNVYIDIKDTRGAKKIKHLTEILNCKYGRIRKTQLMHSYESNLIQVCDFIMGAINYNLRKYNSVISKNKLIAKIKDHSGETLEISTLPSSDKFNLFFINLRGDF